MPIIQTPAQLRALMGEPNPQVPKKIHTRLSRQALAFIARAPMLFLSTTDASGRSTVSPKGDGPGFVRAADDRTLLIPERKGNKLLFSLQNVLANPHVGMIFIVPGTNETLRVSGEAQLLDDRELCEQFVERAQPALLVTRIQVTECYFHCAKAFLRSELWNPASWPDTLKISFGEEIAAEGGLPLDQIERFDSAVQGRYRTEL
jgi:PPOX class probable FMN-dependent enzyme